MNDMEKVIRLGWYPDVEGYEISEKLPRVMREEIASLASVHLPSGAMRYVEMVPGEWIDEIKGWTEEHRDQIAIGPNDSYSGPTYYFYDKGILYYWSYLYKRLTLFDQEYEGMLWWSATEPDETVRNIWMRKDNVISEKLRKERE